MPVLATAADVILMVMLGICGLLFLAVTSVWHGRPTDVIVSRYRRDLLQAWEIDPRQILSDVSEMVECDTCRAAYNYMRSLCNWFYANRFYLPREIAATWMIVHRRLTRIVSLEAYRQDWSEREINVMRKEILARIAHALNPAGELDKRPRRPAAALQPSSYSSRYTVAPSACRRSSNRS
ncbi:MAG TPA: hypothetical protein EYP62_02545 [Kiritimatiellae bacterium]|nr:hypothetical protein [Kiritimatiellia bacterium]